MHRDPARLRAARAARRTSPRRRRGRARRRSSSATRATRRPGWARWSARPSATPCAQPWPASPRAAVSWRATPTPTSRGSSAARSCSRCCSATRTPASAAVHDVEAFGPVATLLPYDSAHEVVELMARGQRQPRRLGRQPRPRLRARGGARRRAPTTAGCTSSTATTRRSRPATARRCRTLVHGGPGRAGGGEELGGLRGRAAPHAAHGGAGLAGHADRRSPAPSRRARPAPRPTSTRSARL